MIDGKTISDAWKQSAKRDDASFPLLEPAVAKNRAAYTVEAAAAMSQAISLKRIADFLNGKVDGSTGKMAELVGVMPKKFTLLQTGFGTACVLRHNVPFAMVEDLASEVVRLTKLDGMYVMSCDGYENACGTVEMNEELWL